MKSKKNYKRIVIKIGSSLFLDQNAIENLIHKISDLINRQGKEVVIVSSGAISCGMVALGLKSRPLDLVKLQAAAAIGQGRLMEVYSSGLEKDGLKCAQVLLTWDDFDQRYRYLNAKNTLLELINLKAVPIVNENDTVSTEEIKFGDNDHLSALVANLIDADLLLILSDVDGLLDQRGELIKELDYEKHKQLACTTDKETCVGGMITKLEAAKMALDSGIDFKIINGRKDVDFFSDSIGTSGVSAVDDSPARKKWIGFGTKPRGKIFIDQGARQALIDNFKSLLSVGVIKVEGDFEAGNTVLVLDESGKQLARGITNYSSEELKSIKGKKSRIEVIHRDNLHIRE